MNSKMNYLEQLPVDALGVIAGLSGRQLLKLNGNLHDLVLPTFMTPKYYCDVHLMEALPETADLVDALEYAFQDYETWRVHFPWSHLLSFLAGRYYYFRESAEQKRIHWKYTWLADAYLRDLEAKLEASVQLYSDVLPCMLATPTWYFCIWLPGVLDEMIDEFVTDSYWRYARSQAPPEYSLIPSTFPTWAEENGNTYYEFVKGVLVEWVGEDSSADLPAPGSEK
jgi:hypothetical protein